MIKDWKINNSEADALNAADITLAFNNMSPDTAFIPLNAAYDSTLNAAFNYGSTVLVKLNDVIVFRGLSDGPRRSGSAPSEGLTVTVKGPWATMEKQIYRQDVSDLYTGGSFTSSETKLSGTITSVVSTLLSFAVSDGAGFVVGTIDLPAITIPEISISGNTVAGALITVLKWCPGAQVIFNYNGAGNQTICNVMKIDSGGLYDVQITDTQAVNYVVRRDLVPTGVRLIYQRPASTKESFTRYGKKNPDITENSGVMKVGEDDIAGASSGPGVLVSTLTLNGTQRTTTYKHFFHASWHTIHEFETSIGVNTLLYWDGAPLKSSGGFAYYSDRFKYVKSFSSHREKVAPTTDLSWWPTEQQLWHMPRHPTHSGWWIPPPEELYNQGIIIFALTYTVKFGLYQSYESAENVEYNWTLLAGCKWDGGYGYSDPNGNTLVAVTNTTTETLESPPPGLAAQIFALRSVLFCEGSYSKVISALDPMRRRILLESIQSPIQQLTLNASSMIAYYAFGPPEQLGPQDLLDLVRSASK